MCTVHTHKNGESSSSSSREESDERRGSPAVKKTDVSVLILMYDNLPAYHQHDQRPAVASGTTVANATVPNVAAALVLLLPYIRSPNPLHSPLPITSHPPRAAAACRSHHL